MIFKYCSRDARIKRAYAAGFKAGQRLSKHTTSNEALIGYWSSACACEAFGSEPSRAYDRAFKIGLRPMMEMRRLL